MEKRQATPDEEIQLPEYETYLIVIQDICKNALAKESSRSDNSIDGFASVQVFRIWLVSGAGFRLVFPSYLLEILL